MTPRSFARRLALLPLVAMFAIACDSASNGPFNPPFVASITVTGATPTMAVNSSQQFTAVAHDSAGNVLAITPTWTIVAGGGSINGSGVVTAGTVAAPFTNTVRVTASGMTGFASFTVTPGPLAIIAVTPTPSAKLVGATQTFVATGADAYGNAVTITPAWTVVAGGGTIVGTTGVFTAGSVPGNYANTVMATSGTVSGFATVSVSSGALASITISPSPVTIGVGVSQQFTAVGRDASNNVVPFTATWSMVNATAGSITAGGLFTASATPGTYTGAVRAASGAINSTVTITVTATPGTLASLRIEPNPASVAVNGTQQFVAIGEDANGAVVTILPAPTWAVVNGGGSINASTGLFNAGNIAGSFVNTVRVTSGTTTGFATVTVTGSANPGALASIVITPSPVTIGTGVSQQFTASGRDANNNIVAISPVWSVVTAASGTILASGVFTASGTPGTYVGTVRAAVGAISQTATVTVTGTPGALATISLTPNPANVNIAATQQFTASGQDATGATVAITPAVTWSVVNGGGTISATGLFTAGSISGSFTNTVRATSGTVSGFASVVVNSAAAGNPGPSFGTANAFAVLGSTAISCIGVSSVAGNVGVAPAGSVSGFPAPCVIAAPGDPTPHVNDAVAMVAQADVTPAYNALAAMPCGTSLSGVDLGGLTLAPGVYCFTSSAQLTGNVTLAGPANGLWVFQVATALTTGTSSQVILSGGAQAKNVYWQIGTSATIGQTTIFRGNIVAAVSITLVQGSTLVGRALSKAGITMDGSTITLP